MTNGKVGAGILNIVTESLYDKPIVIFREYVQNSIDSFGKLEAEGESEGLYSKIWMDNETLYFLDNGKGIESGCFLDEMQKIAYSEKRKTKNIGYKGIGRLSGLPYCESLTFFNIISFKDKKYQKYCLDGNLYKEFKAKLHDMDIDELFEKISTYQDTLEESAHDELDGILEQEKIIFTNQDSGFLVMLKNIHPILKQTIGIDEEDFYKELGWLLPVKFKDELLTSELKPLFEDLATPIVETGLVPAKAYNITFNNKTIERPITREMIRDYTCKTSFGKYAIGFHSFNRSKIAIERGNEFSGIKLYLDNILLCDESELIPIILKQGLFVSNFSANELIQSVKGIGAIIYITDKLNISANARRTFIEMTDIDSFEFLQGLVAFVRSIVEARYNLSRYATAKNNVEANQEKLNKLKEAANLSLKKLARDEITVEIEENSQSEYGDLSETEKKQAVKRKLTREMNLLIKDYLAQTREFEYNTVLSDFITWMSSGGYSPK